MAEAASPARGSLHKGVEQAVHMMWNNQYEEAAALLSKEKDKNPRFSLEFANLNLVKGLMNSTNESRESILELFKAADGLATASKYGQAMVSDSSDEEDDEMVAASTEDAPELTDKERKKIEEKKKKAAEKQREKDKAAFKNAAAKGSVDVSWKLECDVIYADALLVRSLTQLNQNSYMKGGVNLRKTWGCYLALLKELEKDKDGAIPKELDLSIKYGAGAFYIYLALVPAGLMKLLSAMGFISDKDLGEQYLTEITMANMVRSPSAALVLLTYYLFLPTGLGDVKETLAKAKVILDLMCERYPDNSYFWGYLNFYHRKLGHTKEAVEAITKAIHNAERSKNVPMLLRYLLADTYYMDLRFAEARDAYKAVLEMLEDAGTTFAYTGQVALSLAGCYVMLGQPDQANVWVKRVGSMYNPKSKQDANSPKLAAKIVADPRLLPLLGVYILYINRDLAHMAKEHVDKLLEALNKVTEGKDLSSAECTGLQTLFIGVMHKGCGRTLSASDQFAAVMALEKKYASDSPVMPYCCYEAGELEYRQGNLPKAKALFEKGMALKGDGNETLANRYGIAMKQLKRKMAEAGLK